MCFILVIFSERISLWKKEIFSVRHNSALNVVLYDNIELPADKKQLTKVAELRFDGKLFLEHASSV